MAYYAVIDSDNNVAQVIVGEANNEAYGEAFYTKLSKQRCVLTDIDTVGGIHYDPVTGEPSADQSKAFRKNFAGVGFTYDEARDAFIPPQPFPSWSLNEETCLWVAPVAYPSDGAIHNWDEEAGAWVEA